MWLGALNPSVIWALLSKNTTGNATWLYCCDGSPVALLGLTEQSMLLCLQWQPKHCTPPVPSRALLLQEQLFLDVTISQPKKKGNCRLLLLLNPKCKPMKEIKCTSIAIQSNWAGSLRMYFKENELQLFFKRTIWIWNDQASKKS